LTYFDGGVLRRHAVVRHQSVWVQVVLTNEPN
jgi:hypothetical protein